MRSLIFTALTLLSLACAVLARDIITRTGRTYRNVTITRVEQTGIRIMHDDGIAFVEFSDLPSEIRAEVGVTEQAYATAIAAQKQQEAAAVAAATKTYQPSYTYTPTPATTSITTRDYSAPVYSTRDYSADRYTERSYSSGTVHVSGYYRKNGTYVHSYTRHK